MLPSTSNFANAGYITVFDKKEVNIYDASNTKKTVTRDAILKGWQGGNAGYGEYHW